MMSSSVSNDNNDTDKDEFGKKIKYLKMNKYGTFAVNIQREKYKFNKNYKTKDEALEKIKEINKDLERMATEKEAEPKVGDTRILVSPEHAYLLTKYKWHIDKTSGYVKCWIDNVKYTMHRYIMIIVQGMSHLTSIDYIDHINRIKHDNRIENLQIVTRSENAQNKEKKKNASSEYYGVSKSNKKFRVQLRNIDLKLRLSVSYENELHAAWQWNLWVKEYNLTNCNLNDIDEPEDFILIVKQKSDLPEFIYKDGDEYQVRYKGMIKNIDTIKNAELFIQKIKDEYEFNRINEIKAQPILRNSNGYAIIQRKENGITKDIIVDDNIYYDLLINGGIYLGKGYVDIKMNERKVGLHRYLMGELEYNGENKIDHINGNTLDNRMENLRIVTSRQNMQNKKTSKKSTSKYIGVSWIKNNKKWRSRIALPNTKEVNLGSFINEEEAAFVRDIATLKHFGEFGNLNFPENFEFYILMMIDNIFDEQLV